jgi:REP element-mobilizing transposase RayT
MEHKIYYKRNLPHYQPDNSIYFVTFRLSNSLPKLIIQQLKKENELIENSVKMIKNKEQRNKLLNNLHKKYFVNFDTLLDKNLRTNLWLRDERIAKVVADAIMYRQGREYKLYCYCIMPNHVHMVFGVGEDFVSRIADSTARNSVSSYKVTKIMQGLKKFTAREANKILNRSGQFWHRESYDRVIRDVQDFDNTLNYVMQNPVKAGLTNDFTKWKWSFISIE